jgi:hypothetical protein
VEAADRRGALMLFERQGQIPISVVEKRGGGRENLFPGAKAPAHMASRRRPDGHA